MNGGEFPESDPETEDTEFDTPELVHVESPVWAGDVMAMHDMPYQFVMDILITPQPFDTLKTLGLLKLAMGPESDKLELATFAEVMELTTSWVEASNEKRRRDIEALRGTVDERGMASRVDF